MRSLAVAMVFTVLAAVATLALLPEGQHVTVCRHMYGQVGPVVCH